LNSKTVTATSTTTDRPLRPDEKPLAEYRSVSGIAVAAAILGLASPLVLLNPLLAPVPIAAFIAAAVALRTIGASGGQLVGRIPALVGLCLATFFLGWGFTAHLQRQSLLEQRAKEAADGWLELLQNGKAEQAHQFRLSPAARLSSPEALADHYNSNKEAAEDLKSFRSSPGVRDLMTFGVDADVQFEGLASTLRDGFSDIIVLKYSYARPAGERQPIWVHATRRYDETTKRPQWEIGGLNTTPPQGAQ
jgi:hypothetical protein